MTTQTARKTAYDTLNMFKNVKIPSIDFEAAMASHRKNLEVMQTAQKEAFNAVKTISQTNMVYMKQAMEDFKSHMQDTMGSKNLEDKVQSHNNRLKESFEKATSYGKELTNIMNTSRENIASVLGQRMNEGVKEAETAKDKAADAAKKTFKH